MDNKPILPDYYNAFQRHWKDAENLYAASRLPNADQLYAYSAECGLKCLMQQFGMSVDPSSGMPPSEDRVHADKIWDRYATYTTGKGAARHALPPTNPFDDWHMSLRYVHDSNFNKSMVDKHKSGAETVRILIDKAILEGILKYENI